MALALVDTGAVYALFNPLDQNHDAAKAKITILRNTRTEPLLTSFIVAECYALLLSRVGHERARSWLLRNSWRIEPVLPGDEDRAFEIISSHDDKEYSYTDASSFAVMERLGIRRAFAFDHHFEQFGFELI